MCSAQRAFYSLQGAGLCYKGVDTKVAINIFQTAVQTTLTYGCDNIFISRTALNRLDSFQAKLLKSILGLGKQSRTTPLLCAMKVAPVSHILSLHSLDLLTSCLYSNSQCGVLYKYMMSNTGSSFLSKTLLGRVHKFSQDKNFSVTKCVLNNAYRLSVKRQLSSTTPSGVDGFVDSIRNIIDNYTCDNRKLLYNLLRTFANSVANWYVA